MKVNRETLLDALSSVAIGLSPKEEVEQSNCFVLNADGVMTFNDEVAVYRPHAEDTEWELEEVAVNAVPLLKVLRKLNAEFVELTMGDGVLQVQAVGKKRVAGITADAEVKLPVNEIAYPEGDDAWADVPEGGLEAFLSAASCASSEESKFRLMSVHINGDCVEASDNYQLIRLSFDEMYFPQSLMVPAKNLIGVVRSLQSSPVEGATYLATTEGWFHLCDEDGVVYSCRTVDEEYPNLDKIFGIEGEEVNLPKGLDTALERAGIFRGSAGEGTEGMVTLTLTKNNLLVEGQNETGWFKEDIEMEYAGDAFSFSVTPDLLRLIVSDMESMELSNKIVKFTGENFIHCVAIIKQD